MLSKWRPEVRGKADDSTDRRLLLQYLKENFVDEDASDAIRKSCYANRSEEGRHYETGKTMKVDTKGENDPGISPDWCSGLLELFGQFLTNYRCIENLCNETYHCRLHITRKSETVSLIVIELHRTFFSDLEPISTLPDLHADCSLCA